MKYWIMGVGLLCIVLGVITSLTPTPPDMAVSLSMGVFLIIVGGLFFIFEPTEDKK